MRSLDHLELAVLVRNLETNQKKSKNQISLKKQQLKGQSPKFK